MANAIPSREEILLQFQNSVAQGAGITNFSDSSIVQLILEPLASHLQELYQRQILLERNTSLSTATGSALDDIGNMFGLPRKAVRTASTIGEGHAVLFTNTSTSSILVPAGTRIESEDASEVAYKTVTAVTVPAADENEVAGKAYADVTAVGVGETYNVAANVLTRHNVGSVFLSVTNVRAITNGTSAESDDNYRFRIKNALASRGNSQDALYSGLLALPGVRDVVIQPFARGAGTIDAIIVPVERGASDTLITMCQDTAESIVAPGISAKCKAPVERFVEVEISITTTPEADKVFCKTAAQAAIRYYMDNLSIGMQEYQGTLNDSTIVVSSLVADVRYSATDIVDAVVTKLKIDGMSCIIANQYARAGELFVLQGVNVI